MMNETHPLTSRQQAIGLCLLEGKSIKEIAAQFNISIAGVRMHQNLIRKKLQCQNAYQVGYRLGIFLKSSKNSFFYPKTLTFDSDQ